jgi:hypothetical protein
MEEQMSYVIGIPLKNLSKSFSKETWEGVLLNSDYNGGNVVSKWEIVGPDRFKLNLFNDTVISDEFSLGNETHLYITISKEFGVRAEVKPDWDRMFGKTYDKYYDILFILTKDPFSNTLLLLESQLADFLQIASLSDDGAAGDELVPQNATPSTMRIGMPGTVDNLGTVGNYLSPTLVIDGIPASSTSIVKSGVRTLSITGNAITGSIEGFQLTAKIYINEGTELIQIAKNGKVKLQKGKVYNIIVIGDNPCDIQTPDSVYKLGVASYQILVP